MIDQLRALNTTAFALHFADVADVDRERIEEVLKVPLAELFDRQRNADRAKRLLKADFPQAVALYFSRFQSSAGLRAEELGQKLDECGLVFERHLGKDKVKYLRLLINVARLIQEKPKRGLLGVA